MNLARPASLAAAALLLAACAATPGTNTTPKATIPGGGTPAVGATPTAGGGGGAGTAAPNGASVCTLVTADEMTQIFGTQMTISSDETTTCTYTATSGLPSVVTRFESTALTTAKLILGTTAADVTVAGNPGVIGNLMGVILYVQHGSQDLVVQAPLLEDTPDNRTKVVAVATKALSRIP